MNYKNIITTSALVLALTVASVAPAIAGGQKGKGKGHDKDNGNSQAQVNRNQKQTKHWNPAPPKKNGRHDNRDWNKQSNWKRFPDGSPYAVNGSKYYYDNKQFNSLAALEASRQKSKNEWRNIAYIAGAVSVLGILKKDNRLVFAGAAGGLYALWRYEQDRKSQSNIDSARASYFSKPYFTRDGQRYDRRIVTKDGEKYYQFVRAG